MRVGDTHVYLTSNNPSKIKYKEALFIKYITKQHFKIVWRARPIYQSADISYYQAGFCLVQLCRSVPVLQQIFSFFNVYLFKIIKNISESLVCQFHCPDVIA